jgi:hypothetical protein
MRMKEMWYFIAVMLMLGVLGGFASMSSPAGAFAANIPPQWDFPTSEFMTDGRLTINLEDAFFDPDGDVLSFSVSPSPGVSAGLQGDVLVVMADSSGEVTVTASDGQNLVSQKIVVVRR